MTMCKVWILQAMKARGEPLLTGFDCTTAGMAAAFKPMGWGLTELLSPKYALPRLLVAPPGSGGCFPV